MSDRTQLGDLQLAIMREIWAPREATVAQVHDALRQERGLAPTTIATMLKKMEKKGVVEHRTEGRTFVYRPTVSEHVVTRSMVAALTDRLFSGNVTALVSYLLNEHQIDEQELDELRELVAAADREEQG